ncbi:methyltransferase domain-containing protein [Pseudoxanthomonas suwonensis]|uniref:Methyltransferase type 11 domain-containing protein n=1 Tax=Pseudoxanthomonas suwonensis TaxID=314722 RepID=A0A0E3Z494_9GAMM|nr:methyltransferase domain-containing protein [Pseudoxanthomonas suwonensis]AKC87224.1 hypothetical protein WQ53_11190 [Pseudoxanthomonas suwonensis]
MADIIQHDKEITENLASWNSKPLLRLVYRAMHVEIASELSGVPGDIIEVGSGIGNIKEVIPQCVRTDLFPNPWLDRTENVYALTCEDASVANLILFDVFHHLRYPGTALREIHRVLRPGGRAILYEPAMGLLGRIVFGAFHHEPIALSAPITWTAPEGWTADDADYYAAQGNASRIFPPSSLGTCIEGLRLDVVRRSAQLSYVASGGYSGRQLYPDSAYPAMRKLDGILDLLPSIFATRMLVALRKPED